MFRTDGKRYYSARLREEFASQGPVGLSKLVALNLKRKAVNTNKATWYHLCLGEFSSSAHVDASTTFDLMSLNEASDFFKRNHKSFPWMFLERELEVALEAEHLFPCLRDKGKVVGYIKLGIGKVFIVDFERIMHIPPTTAFVYDTFVMPSHRHMGLGTLLVDMTARLARDKGFRNLWCHIPSWNGPSIRAFGKVGFKPVGEVRFLRLLGKEFFCRRHGMVPLSFDGVPGECGALKLNEDLAG